MKLAIIGSRTLNQQQVIQVIEQVITKSKTPVTTIVTGGANGVDSIAEYYAKMSDINIEVYYPVYSQYGKRAPLIRNNEIIKNCDGVLAIWDGESNGTAYTIRKAKKENKPVMVVELEAAKPYHDNVWNIPHQGRPPKEVQNQVRVA
jgi:predicted Rossmann fold nucleotide-binding protein DprA/Smf involved in DNA uptake